MVKIKTGKRKVGSEVCEYIECSELLGATEEERRRVGQAILDWLDKDKEVRKKQS